MDQTAIREAISESIATKQRLLDTCLDDIAALCEAGVKCIQGGGKLLFCGNGGSSCDAAHGAGELVGWFERMDRDGYPAIALGHEVPSLTAVANDAGYEFVFARQLKALGRPGDMLVGISTSGNSKNVVLALEEAKKQGIASAALTGRAGNKVAELADIAVRVPSDQTPRIQESHLLCVHMLCSAIERTC